MTESTRIRLSTPSDSESDTSTMTRSRRKQKLNTNKEKSKDRVCDQCHNPVKIGGDMYRFYRTGQTVCKVCWSTIDPSTRKSIKRVRQNSETKLCNVFLHDVLKGSSSKDEKSFKMEKDNKGNSVYVISDESSEDGTSPMSVSSSSKVQMEKSVLGTRKRSLRHLKTQNDENRNKEEKSKRKIMDKLNIEEEEEEEEGGGGKKEKKGGTRKKEKEEGGGGAKIKDNESIKEEKQNNKKKKLIKKTKRSSSRRKNLIEKLNFKEEQNFEEKSNGSEIQLSSEGDYSSEEIPIKKRKVSNKRISRISQASNQGNGLLRNTPHQRQKSKLLSSDSDASLPKIRTPSRLHKRISISDSSESSRDNQKKIEIESSEESVRITRHSKLSNSPLNIKKRGKRKMGMRKKDEEISSSFKSPVRKKSKTISKLNESSNDCISSEESSTYSTKDKDNVDQEKDQREMEYTCSECGISIKNKLEGLSHQLSHFQQVEVKLCRIEIPQKVSDKVGSKDDLTSEKTPSLDCLDSQSKDKLTSTKHLMDKNEEHDGNYSIDNGKDEQSTGNKDEKTELENARKSLLDTLSADDENNDDTDMVEKSNDGKKKTEKTSLKETQEKEEDKEETENKEVNKSKEKEKTKESSLDKESKEIEKHGKDEEEERVEEEHKSKETNKNNENKRAEEFTLSQQENKEEKSDNKETDKSKKQKTVEKSSLSQQEKEEKEEDKSCKEKNKDNSSIIISREVSQVESKQIVGHEEEKEEKEREKEEGNKEKEREGDKQKEKEENKEKERTKTNEKEDEDSEKVILLEDELEEKEVESETDIRIVDSGSSEDNVESIIAKRVSEQEIDRTEEKEKEVEVEVKERDREIVEKDDLEVTKEIINDTDATTDTICENTTSKPEDKEIIRCEPEELTPPKNSNDSNTVTEDIKEVFDLAEAELRNRQQLDELDNAQLYDTDSETLENISREIHNNIN